MTTEQSMVERVARAIAPAAWEALGIGDTLACKNRRIASERHARRAIAALRDLSPDITESASYLAGDFSRRNIEAFVDAALKP